MNRTETITDDNLIDKRFIWLQHRLMNSMRFKSLELKKIFENDDNCAQLIDFMDVADNRKIFFYTSGNNYIFRLEPPVDTKKKFMYITKLKREKLIDVNTLMNNVVMGDLNTDTLQYLHIIAKDIFFPLIRNKMNLQVSDTSVKALQSYTQTLINQILITLGLSKDRTLLPCPLFNLPTDLSNAVKDKDLIFQIECTFVAWSIQIKEAIKSTPEHNYEKHNKSMIKSNSDKNIDNISTYSTNELQGVSDHYFPLDEIEFWKNKTENLENLEAELYKPDIIVIRKIIEKIDSPYSQPFNLLMHELSESLTQSRENYIELKPLTAMLSEITPGTSKDINQLLSEGYFTRLFHLFFIIFSKSQHFSGQPTRLMTMMVSVCNAIIEMAKEYITVSEIFQIEIPDATDKLINILNICSAMKKKYFYYKNFSFQNKNQWKIQNQIIFDTLDLFLERCHDILDILKNTALFARLEAMKIGGASSIELSNKIDTIHADYNKYFVLFTSKANIFFTMNKQEYNAHLNLYKDTILVMEQRLSSVLIDAINETQCINTMIKVMDSFEDFIERPFVKNKILYIQNKIVNLYNEELLDVYGLLKKEQEKHIIFNSSTFSLCIYRHIPPMATKLIWIKSMLARIYEPYSKITLFDSSVMNSEIAKSTLSLFDSLVEELHKFSANCFTDWSSTVNSIVQEKKKLSLFVRTKNSLLETNFDEQLVLLLKESHYVKVLNSYDHKSAASCAEFEHYSLPSEAQIIHESEDKYHKQILALQHISIIYNNIITTLHPDELALINAELVIFEKEVENGISHLNWNSQNIDDYISICTSNIENLNSIMDLISRNKKTIQEIIEDLINSTNILPYQFSRGDKTSTSVEFKKKITQCHQHRLKICSHANDTLCKLAENTLKIINEKRNERMNMYPFELINKDSSTWINYLQYIEFIIEEQLSIFSIHCLQQLKNQLSLEWMQSNGGVPLFEIKLTLSNNNQEFSTNNELMYAPSISNPTDKSNSITDIIYEVLDGIFEVSNSIKRISSLNGVTTFLEKIKSNCDIQSFESEIHSLLKYTNQSCQEFLSSFYEHSILWETNIEDYVKKFSSPVNTVANNEHEFLDMDGDINEKKERKVTHYFNIPLTDFDKAITDCERRSGKICTSIPEKHKIVFLKIDLKPLKAALITICKKWKKLYINSLTTKIRKDLNELQSFINESDIGLNNEVQDGDVESLKAVMHHIRNCRVKNVEVIGNAGPDASSESSGIFPPIQAAIEMLRTHELTEEEQGEIEALDAIRKPAPENWNTLYKKSLIVRAHNSIVQDREAENIKARVTLFEEENARMKEDFHKTPLFSYNVPLDRIYSLLDQQSIKFKEVEENVVELHKLQLLFDLTPVEFQDLKSCRQDLVLLKNIWDMIVHIRCLFTDWMKSSFMSVNVEEILDEIKKLSKQIKTQPIKVRQWGCYKGIEVDVANMSKALPLCAELRSKAMRERHWKQLLEVTKFSDHQIDPTSPHFTLQNLIDLELHRYAEDIGTIVEKSTKELGIEKALGKIEVAWDKLEFTYEYDKQYDTYLLGPIDDIVELLENDNTSLQSMLSNRFVDFFSERVNTWQKNLTSIDFNVMRWASVQRQWYNIYSIFMLSDDIKQQLANEARNFETADILYRRVMLASHKHTNIINVICTDVVSSQLDDSLENTLITIENTLLDCEKALTRYLEMKRKIFPRFYFVSSADLIHILSKGSDPKSVMIHMSKIIDAIEYFSLDNNPNPNANPKDIHNFVSVQGEKVKLFENFTCDGAVEEWLNGCILAMQTTIKHHILEANLSYIEKPRTEWIYQHPCQAIIVASRIWFTTEVHQAFSLLEEGSDSAMKDTLKQQYSQLDGLIREVQGDRLATDRKMLVHLITIDVHNRDIIQNMVDEKTDSSDAFIWQSQLRYYWHENNGQEIRICDSEFINGYEYIGLCGCLVVTKLTDRCYVTLSQALRLKKGGAPAGPAGTGKTETTKDLARNLGIACYVFNCSDQMNYQTLGAIFKGLAMSGSWGCFDEFNRISIEVLSVVATQVGSILNALKDKGRKKFKFFEEEIAINHAVGCFITMNPGYAGRTELPENIKSLFRPCAMVVPDLKNICEIMLAAEGFTDAKDLALKFVTLYRLNKELLSAQDHYDWGLRAVKSVLYIAGSLKRNAPSGTPERKYPYEGST